MRNAHLHTQDEELQLALSRKGRWSLRAGHRPAAAPAAAVEHNREKQRLLTLDRPFLAALGVADAQARLVPAMARKWKQINRFLEVIGAALAASPLATQQHIEVLDFGSGKGYLTFALHDHLRQTLGRDAQVTGVELRPDMVALCNGIAERLGLQGLRFEQGDVRQLRAARGGPDDRAARLRHRHRSRHPLRASAAARRSSAARPAATSSCARSCSARTRCGRSCSTACTWARRPRC